MLALDDYLGEHILIFFIKLGLVAIASDQDIRHPGRRPSHDGSDANYTGILRAFDNKLIMDMTAYLLIREVMHGIVMLSLQVLG